MEINTDSSQGLFSRKALPFITFAGKTYENSFFFSKAQKTVKINICYSKNLTDTGKWTDIILLKEWMRNGSGGNSEITLKNAEELIQRRNGSEEE